MAGTNVDFNAASFRTAIKQTMQMGLPDDPDERLTWRWNTIKNFPVSDTARRPYDFSATPSSSELPSDAPAEELQVDYAIEFSASSPGDTSVGQFDVSRAVVTMLDTDYEQVKTADYAIINGSVYEIDFSAPPIGMFEVSVYQIYLRARDES